MPRPGGKGIIMRTFLIGIVVLIAIVIGAGLLFYSQLDGIVSAAIEKVGSEATQSEVDVEGLDITVTDGTATLSSLTIGNPSGFGTASAFSLDGVDIAIAIDPEGTGQDVLVLKHIRVASPKVRYELLGDGSSNIQTIQKNVEAFAKRFSGGGSSGGAGSGGGEGDEQKLIVDLFEMSAGEITVVAPGGKEASVNLPEIRLTDLGRSQGGITGAELTTTLLDTVTDKVVTSVAKAQVLDALGIGKDLPGGIGDAVKDLF